ncbi:YlbD family protein [Bacillus pinisoli]|uniref:YlbD family protein n=1 Tax=Bacillus pinisoli TaxID=2901866 RepID=UPI001FF3F1F9|nr:YlbD family protein [Bacillus pinisoli]
MSKKTLHPSIQKFKQFVKKHPKLVAEVKKENKTWQELYEEWYLLGEDDEVWKQYRNDGETKEEEKDVKGKTDFMNTILTAVKGMDYTQVQQHISNFGDAISNIQQLIGQFQGTKGASNSNPQQNQPFFFNKD